MEYFLLLFFYNTNLFRTSAGQNPANMLRTYGIVVSAIQKLDGWE